MARPIALAGSDGTLLDQTDNDRTFKLMGWSIRETGGAVASLRLRERSASGAIVGAVSLVANGHSVAWFGPQGITCSGDLLEDTTAGAYEGCVYVA